MGSVIDIIMVGYELLQPTLQIMLTTRIVEEFQNERSHPLNNSFIKLDGSKLFFR